MSRVRSCIRSYEVQHEHPMFAFNSLIQDCLLTMECRFNKRFGYGRNLREAGRSHAFPSNLEGKHSC